MNTTRPFDPENIAVTDASRAEGEIGYGIMANTVVSDSPAYPITPSAHGPVFDERFGASITDVDDDVDEKEGT